MHPKSENPYLNSVTYKDNDSLRKLISTSLVLENLSITRTEFDNVGKVCISAPALKRLTVGFMVDEEMFWGFGSVLVLEVNAPALQYLDMTDSLSERLFVTKFDNLIEADVNIKIIANAPLDNSRDYASAVKFMEAIINAKFLYI